MKKILIMIVVLVVILVGGFFIFKSPLETEMKTTGQVIQTGETKEFEIIAKQWEFVPNIIEVNKGDLVRLKIKSVDVTHGFAIIEFGISKTLKSGKEIEVEFVADKTGIFNFYCTVPCGPGHSDMKGMLVVK